MPGGIRRTSCGKSGGHAQARQHRAAWKELSRRAAPQTARVGGRRCGAGRRGRGVRRWDPCARGQPEQDAQRARRLRGGRLESPAPPEGTGMLRRLLAIRAGRVVAQVAQRVRRPLEAPLLTKGRGARARFQALRGPDGGSATSSWTRGGHCAAFSLPRELNRSAARVSRDAAGGGPPLLWGS